MKLRITVCLVLGLAANSSFSQIPPPVRSLLGEALARDIDQKIRPLMKSSGGWEGAAKERSPRNAERLFPSEETCEIAQHGYLVCERVSGTTKSISLRALGGLLEVARQEYRSTGLGGQIVLAELPVVTLGPDLRTISIAAKSRHTYTLDGRPVDSVSNLNWVCTRQERNFDLAGYGEVGVFMCDMESKFPEFRQALWYWLPKEKLFVRGHYGEHPDLPVLFMVRAERPSFRMR